MATLDIDLSTLTGVQYNGTELTELWIDGVQVFPINTNTKIVYSDGIVDYIESSYIRQSDFSLSDKDRMQSVTIGTICTILGDSVFANCVNLAEVYIPTTVTNIGTYGFSYCSSLASIELPSSMATINTGLFYRCSAFTKVTIPASIKTIKDYAFYDCGSLSEVIFNGTIAQWENVSKGSSWHNNVPATYVTCTDGTAALN